MPVDILFCGLPGVGKTTLAMSVASRTGASILSSDKVRKELIRYPTYASAEGRLIYDVLMLLTKYLNNDSRENYIKTAIIRLMSTPEYQLC